MADQFAKLRVDIEARTADIDRKMDKLNKNLKRTRRNTTLAGKAFKKMSGYLIAAFGVRAVVSGIRNTVSELDKLAKSADRVGVSIEGLQVLRFGGLLEGISDRTVDMAMQRFSRRLGEVAQGRGELYKTAKAMGLALREENGTMRTTEAILRDYAEAIKNAESDQERLRLAFKAFDSEGAAMVALLRDGSEGLDALAEAAREAGIVMSEDTVRRMEKAQQRWDIAVSKMRAGWSLLIDDMLTPFVRLDQEIFGDLIEEITELQRITAERPHGLWGWSEYNDARERLGPALKELEEITLKLSLAEAERSKTIDVLGQKQEDLWKGIEDLRGSQQEYYKETTVLLETGTRVADMYDEWAQNVWRVGASFTDATDQQRIFMQEISEGMHDVDSDMETVKQSADSTFGAIENSIATLATTGKLNFKNMAESILSDLSRILTHALIVQALTGMFGGTKFGTAIGLKATAKGGAFNGGRVIPMASGGIIDRPTIFPMARGAGLAGEAGPEAIMPLARDPRTGKLGVVSRGGGGVAPVININIANSSPSSPENDQRMAQTASREMSKAMRDVMRNALMDEARPGGVLNRL